MGRWSYLDTDEERLPEGMRRVGYDARTQTYTYRDEGGRAWEGVPGARYGRLHRANTTNEARRANAVASTTYGSMGPNESGEDEDEDEDNFDQEGEGGAAKDLGRKRFAHYLDGKARQLRRWSSVSVARVIRTGQGTASSRKSIPGYDDGVRSPTGESNRGDLEGAGGEGVVQSLGPKEGGTEKGAEIGTTTSADGNMACSSALNVNEKPLPPLPLPVTQPPSGRSRRRRQRRRASTISNITRGVAQMFSDESGYRSRRV